MPQPRTLCSLSAAAVLACLLLALPAPGAAATTKGCLATAIAACADAAGDAEGRLACLDASLATCRGWCPDVATPCARERLKRLPAEEWRKVRLLAPAIADACFMDVNCSPPRERHPVPSKVVMP